MAKTKFKILPIVFLGGILVALIGISWYIKQNQLTPTETSAHPNDLTCFYDHNAIPPITKREVFSGDGISLGLGISEPFGGIIVSYELINNKVPIKPLNILEARSGAGAANQFSDQMTTYDNHSLLSNQGVGNAVGYQWGYNQKLVRTTQGSTVVFTSSNYIPMYTDTFDSKGTSPCTEYNQASNNFQLLNNIKSDMIIEKVATGKTGNVIKLTRTYSVKAIYNQYWKIYVPTNATYLSLPAAKEGQLRIYYGMGNSTVIGPLDPTKSLPEPKGFTLVNNASFGPVLQSPTNTKYAIFMYKVSGVDIGVAFVPINDGASLRLAKSVYCTDTRNPHCGAIDFIVNRKVVSDASFTKDSIQRYTYVNYIGTRAQLAGLGFILPE